MVGQRSSNSDAAPSVACLDITAVITPNITWAKDPTVKSDKARFSKSIRIFCDIEDDFQIAQVASRIFAIVAEAAKNKFKTVIISLNVPWRLTRCDSSSKVSEQNWDAITAAIKWWNYWPLSESICVAMYELKIELVFLNISNTFQLNWFALNLAAAITPSNVKPRFAWHQRLGRLPDFWARACEPPLICWESSYKLAFDRLT